MSTLARYALPGIILASAVGAFIMCLLVIRYGFVADEEDPDERADRQVVTRFGHAAAAVCFAIAAMLAAVAMSTGSTAMIGSGPASGERDNAIARLDEDLRRLEERLSRELKALAERVAAAPTARSEEAAVTVEPEPEAPPPRPSRPTPSPAARPRAARPLEQNASALAAPSSGDRFRARVHGVAIDVERGTGGEGRSLFVVRLSDAAGHPLAGAEVSLVGTLAGGALVQAPLEPGAAAGVYRGSLPASAPVRNLRLRVVQRDKRFELALTHGVSW